MPETYVVHLGNSKELMEVAEDSVAKNAREEHRILLLKSKDLNEILQLQRQ